MFLFSSSRLEAGFAAKFSRICTGKKRLDPLGLLPVRDRGCTVHCRYLPVVLVQLPGCGSCCPLVLCRGAVMSIG